VVQAALQRLDHPWRVRVDIFLVESLLYEEILEQNKKGLVVPANSIPAMFIKKWKMRPIPHSVNEILNKLQRNEREYKKMWCRRFRHRWQLCVTEFIPRTPMDTPERQFRVTWPDKQRHIENMSSKSFALSLWCDVFLNVQGAYCIPENAIVKS
jgi:hypothetical protein